MSRKKEGEGFEEPFAPKNLLNRERGGYLSQSTYWQNRSPIERNGFPNGQIVRDRRTHMHRPH